MERFVFLVLEYNIEYNIFQKLSHDQYCVIKKAKDYFDRISYATKDPSCEDF